jgi:hypothetical protein
VAAATRTHVDTLLVYWLILADQALLKGTGAADAFDDDLTSASRLERRTLKSCWGSSANDPQQGSAHLVL